MVSKSTLKKVKKDGRTEYHDKMRGKKAVHYTTRRKRIAKLAQQIGVFGLNKSKIADEMNVSSMQIKRDIEWLAEHEPIERIPTVIYALESHYIKVCNEMMKIILDPASSKMEKISAAKTLLQASKDITKFYEDYRLKDKVAEKLDIKSDEKKRFVFNIIKPDGNNEHLEAEQEAVASDKDTNGQ